MPAIQITEVSPRDGLQNESVTIPTAAKIAFINALSQTGVHEIEVTSFVSPQWVPQLADAEEVCKGITRNPNVLYSALVPNEKGMERALQCHLKKVALFTAASESFNKKNINATISESIERFKPVIRMAKENRVTLRGYISTAFHCPYEGSIEPEKTIALARQLLQEGVDELAIADTIGKASPDDVRTLLEKLLKSINVDQISLHFHDTYGMAIANALTAYREFGIFRFDSSAGGLGGCPYAAGASGNVATEDLIYALKRAGAELEVKILSIIDALQPLAPLLSHPLTSKLYQLGLKGGENLQRTAHCGVE